MGVKIPAPKKGQELVDKRGIPHLRTLAFFDLVSETIENLPENKQYVGGTDFTVTGPAGFSLTRGVILPYQCAFDGAYRARINIHYTITAGISGTIDIQNLDFKSGVTQVLNIYANSGNSNSAIVTGGDGEIDVTLGSAGTIIVLSGDLELNGKPTWMD
jgi:hypothetical protein